MNKEMNIFKKLLIDFNHITKQIPREPTFLEIRGSSHLENLSSNLLSFYFDTNEVHNLKDLMLKSLFDTILEVKKELFITDTTVLNVETEVLTKENKRIDLLIETDNYVIVIENKIWHDLKNLNSANPLDKYSEYIDENYKEKKPIKLVLSMSDLKEGEKTLMKANNFKSITHSNLYKNVRKNLGSYTSEANQKYLTYLNDYMNSNRNLMEGEPVNEDLLKFYTENFAEITEFEDRVRLAKKENKKRIEFVIGHLKGGDYLTKFKFEECFYWIYKDFALVHELKINDNYTLAIDCVFAEDLEIILWIRKGNKSNLKLKELSFYNENNVNELNRLVYYKKEKFNLLEDSKVVSDKIKELITNINNEIEIFPTPN